jgi:ADP-ribosyl-[dinitrogen reductase] hydrolase
MKSSASMAVPPPPLPNSYWVFPGQLLAGEYPGALKPDVARARIQRLLEAGINYFVDLTMLDEMPPYESELPANVGYARLSISDHDIPARPSEMVEILECVRAAMRAQRRIYVHCRAGIGRTGTVVGCLLVEGGIVGDDALYELNRLWQKCARSQTWSAVPETDDQVEYVRRWKPQLQREKGSGILGPEKLWPAKGPRTVEPAQNGGPARTKPQMPSEAAPASSTQQSSNFVSKVIAPLFGSSDDTNSALTPAALAAAQPPARNVRERFVGALVGLAVCDALAAPSQQQRSGSFAPITDMVGGGVLELPQGAWSDDTAMALCLTESLLECRGFDARDQVERYTRWHQNGYLSATGQCLGITPNTARSLAVAQWRRQLFAGSHDPQVVEPSPLSRIAPSVMFYLPFKEQALEFASDSVRTTCQAPTVLKVCKLFAAMLHAALEGQPKAQVLAPPWDLPEDKPRSRIRGLIESRYRTKDPTQIHAGDHILEVLELALWAFDRTKNFAEGALLVANSGENSDVAGAAYGQLAGAYYGIESIPAPWRNALIKRDLIEDCALRLLAQTKVEPTA